MTNNRFTIVNDNRDQILISRSLREKMTRQKQQQNLTSSTNEDIPIKTPVNEPITPSTITFTEGSDQSRGVPTSTIYPELPSLPKH
ncbi:hypothetical protein BLA29_014218, partial [Euroglyphus maynei]